MHHSVLVIEGISPSPLPCPVALREVALAIGERPQKRQFLRRGVRWVKNITPPDLPRSDLPEFLFEKIGEDMNILFVIVRFQQLYSFGAFGLVERFV